MVTCQGKHFFKKVWRIPFYINHDWFCITTWYSTFGRPSNNLQALFYLIRHPTIRFWWTTALQIYKQGTHPNLVWSPCGDQIKWAAHIGTWCQFYTFFVLFSHLPSRQWRGTYYMFWLRQIILKHKSKHDWIAFTLFSINPDCLHRCCLHVNKQLQFQFQVQFISYVFVLKFVSICTRR